MATGDTKCLRKRTCAVQRLMSALGQKQTYAVQNAMSALPLKADMCSARAYVRYGPIVDSCIAAINAWLRTGIDVG